MDDASRTCTVPAPPEVQAPRDAPRRALAGLHPRVTMERDGLVLVALDRRKDDDPQRTLAAWSTAHGGMDPGSHMREAGGPISFWDRVGD